MPASLQEFVISYYLAVSLTAIGYSVVAYSLPSSKRRRCVVAASRYLTAGYISTNLELFGKVLYSTYHRILAIHNTFLLLYHVFYTHLYPRYFPHHVHKSHNPSEVKSYSIANHQTLCLKPQLHTNHNPSTHCTL